MVQDKFNIDMIYLTKKNGTTWFMNNSDPESDSRFYVGSSVNGLVKSGSWWKCKDNDKVRLNAQTPKTVTMDNALGGCKLHFADAEERGHAGMSDAWRNVEMTCMFNLSTFDPSDGRLILKGPTFHHDDAPCCSGHAYGVRFFFRNPLEIQFFKEMWHVNYFSRPDSPVATKYGSIKDGFDHICKFIVYSRTKNSKEVRVLEAWLDDDGDGKNFTKVGTVTDAGNWGTGGDVCRGDEDQILTWGSGWMQYRWDADNGNTNLKFKNWSCREIDVDLNEDTTPTDPIDTRSDTTNLVIPLVLNFDVNARRTSPCATGVSSDPFYFKAVTQDTNQWRTLCDHANHSNRIRYGNYAPTTGSGLYNRKLVAARLPLAKGGSPAASPPVWAKIWKGSGGSILSNNSIDPTTLTTTMTYYNFDFTGNSYTTQVGDRVVLEYVGTDPNNNVRTCYLQEDAGTDASQYENDGTGWVQYDSRVASCEYFE